MIHQHLSRDNRITIAGQMMNGASVAAIAGMTGRHRSTIYRELPRNGLPKRHYEEYAAHGRMGRRHRKVGELPRKSKGKLLRQGLAQMKNGWSPDVIAGRMSGIGKRTIYDYLHRPHRYLVRELSGGRPFAGWRWGWRYKGRWYVCDPRRPDQRGSVEGVIRQMRRWYPHTMPATDINASRLAAGCSQVKRHAAQIPGLQNTSGGYDRTNGKTESNIESKCRTSYFNSANDGDFFYCGGGLWRIFSSQ